jgi:hypothetical protein
MKHGLALQHYTGHGYSGLSYCIGFLSENFKMITLEGTSASRSSGTMQPDRCSVVLPNHRGFAIESIKHRGKGQELSP